MSFDLKLKETTHLAVHFLDNVIDVNRYPLDKIEQMTKANRKIGLGIMGWADMLIALGLPYNSEAATVLAGEIMGFIQREARSASTALVLERGNFPNHAGSIYDGKYPLRNATVTTIAPTGTLSIIAGCSSGIEPLFAVSYVRTVMEGTKLIEVNPLFEKAAKERGFWSRELMGRIAEQGSIHGFTEIPEDIKRVFVTAHDITPVEHIRMQAAFQAFVDNAVSKTVNFPHNATKQDVENVYLLAHHLGCKGVTVYRDGSREEQVLSKGASQKAASDQPERQKIVPRKRPEVLKGNVRLVKTGCGNVYVTITEDDKGQLNVSYDPQEMTLLVGAVADMVGVMKPAVYIQKAAGVHGESMTLFMRVRAQLMDLYNETYGPVTSFVDAGGTSFLKTRRGKIIGIFPLDYIVWTARLAAKEAEISRSIKALVGVTGKELWFTGKVTAPARAALERRGWKVEDNIQGRLLQRVHY